MCATDRRGLSSRARRKASSARARFVRRPVDELADHPVAAAELRPRRREGRVHVQALPVEVAGPRQRVVSRGRARSRAGRARRRGRCAARSRRGRRRRRRRAAGRQRLDHALRDVVLQPEQVAERRLHRVRREQRARPAPRRAGRWRAAGRRRAAACPSRTRSTSASAASALRSGASPAKRAAAALERTTSEADPRERRGDRVGEAEGQEVGLGIGAQEPERQHHQAGQRRGPGPACRRRRRRATARSSSAIASAEAGRSAGRLASARRITRSTAATAGRAGERRRLLVERGVQDLDQRCAAEGRAAREHLEQDGAGREQVGARVDRLARAPARAPCSAACPSRCPCRVSSVPEARATAPARSGQRAAPGRSRAASRRGA